MSDEIKITFAAADLARLQAAFSRLTWANIELSAPLGILGREMLDTFQRSFVEQQSPAGETWAPLAPRTQARVLRHGRGHRRSGERRGGEHILQAARVPGWLDVELGMHVGAYTLEVGAMRPGPAGYRAEFGDAAINDPARPFVQLTDAMRDRAAELLLAHVARRWR